MESIPNAATPDAPRHARKTTKAAGRARLHGSAPRASRPRPKPVSNTEPPFMPIDAEVIADLQDFTTRKVRAFVREQPLASVAGALAVGFVVGGGWRTRLGRMLALAAARHAALKAAEHYFSA